LIDFTLGLNMNQNIVWHEHRVNQNDRANAKNQKPCILWFTGLSCSGKSSVANAVEGILYQENKHTYLLDGDNIRHGLNKGLTFSDIDRIENIRRVGEVAKLFSDAGLIVLTAFISPFEADRTLVRRLVSNGEFVEIFIDVPIEICEKRDSKGLYKKARTGQIKHFTGIDSPYEPPTNPEIHIDNYNQSAERSAQQVIDYLRQHQYI
jgi:adenylylsulfate kinase